MTKTDQKIIKTKMRFYPNKKYELVIFFIIHFLKKISEWRMVHFSIEKEKKNLKHIEEKIEIQLQ